MDWTRLCYMVYYYISSYIYHIYIYLKNQNKQKDCKFSEWDLTGIQKPSAQYPCIALKWRNETQNDTQPFAMTRFSFKTNNKKNSLISIQKEKSQIKLKS